MMNMLFSLNHKSKHKQEADEIRCPVNQLGLIFPFIKDNPNKRYNIIVADGSSIEYNKLVEQIEYVKEVVQNNNYTIECGDIITFHGFAENGYNAYLRFPVTDWETFDNLKQMGVSDIYIDGPLGFSCPALIKAKEDSAVKIRISPTISPNASLSSSTNASSFFVRPEDLPAYEEAFDIIDFKMPNQEKEDTLFTIYKRGTFNYNLQELIEELNIRVPNLFVRPEFAKQRFNCGQRCRVPGKSCHLCDTQFSLTNALLDYFKEGN